VRGPSDLGTIRAAVRGCGKRLTISINAISSSGRVMLSARLCVLVPEVRRTDLKYEDRGRLCVVFFFATSVSLYSVYNINEVFVIAAGELGREGLQKLQM
jgi:hypothetical protein